MFVYMFTNTDMNLYKVSYVNLYIYMNMNMNFSKNIDRHEHDDEVDVW